MTTFDTATLQLGAFRRVVRAVVWAFVFLALAAAGGVGLLGLLLLRDGFDPPDLVVVLLLAAPVMVLVFAAGIRELLQLPERMRRLPRRGVEHVDELARIADDARVARWRHTPVLVWRTGSLASSTRDLVRIALPLKIFTPGFLWLTLAAVVACFGLIAVGSISFLVLAFS